MDTQIEDDDDLPTLSSRAQAKKRCNIEKEKAKLEKQKEKEEAKKRKLEEKEKQKKEKEAEKLRQKTLREINKNTKPGNCLKLLLVMIDPHVLQQSWGGQFLEHLQKEEIKYEIQGQVEDNIITFWREVTEVKEGNSFEILKTEEVQDQLLIVLPLDLFITLVYANKEQFAGTQTNLVGHVTRIRQVLENRHVTLIVQGLDQYYRSTNNSVQRQYRKQVLGGTEAKTKKGRETFTPAVTRLDVEEALVDLQMQTNTNVIFTESDADTVTSVMRFAKAVAEAPFKRARSESGFSFHVESSGTVKVDKDGQGVTQAWRQQLQQFKLVTAQVANAIIAEYPSPLSLYKAYQRCISSHEAEALLQDITVRRGAGALETNRRVGKELSRRMYQLMTENDPSLVIS